MEASIHSYKQVEHYPNKRDHHTSDHDPSQVSFVLERNFG